MFCKSLAFRGIIKRKKNLKFVPWCPFGLFYTPLHSEMFMACYGLQVCDIDVTMGSYGLICNGDEFVNTKMKEQKGRWDCTDSLCCWGEVLFVLFGASFSGILVIVYFTSRFKLMDKLSSHTINAVLVLTRISKTYLWNLHLSYTVCLNICISILIVVWLLQVPQLHEFNIKKEKKWDLWMFYHLY